MNQKKTDDPKRKAKAFLEEMKLHGYSLELSMENLMENIESILESSLSYGKDCGSLISY